MLFEGTSIIQTIASLPEMSRPFLILRLREGAESLVKTGETGRRGRKITI